MIIAPATVKISSKSLSMPARSSASFTVTISAPKILAGEAAAQMCLPRVTLFAQDRCFLAMGLHVKRQPFQKTATLLKCSPIAELGVFGGYIVLKLSGKPGSTLRVPYYGLKGNYQKLNPIDGLLLGAY